MTVWEWWAILARRWPVALAGLLCTVCAVYLVHKRPIIYQACGSVIVTLPKSSTPNVYNAPQNALIIVTGLVAQGLMSQQVQQRLVTEGLTATYQAGLLNSGTPEVPQYSEPLANMCASSHNPGLSLRTADALVQEFGTILQARQTVNAAPQKFLTDSVIVAPVSLPVLGRPSQAYLGVGIIGLTVTAACVVWGDQFVRLRSRRRGRSDVPSRSQGAPKRAFRTLLPPWRAQPAGRSGGD